MSNYTEHSFLVVTLYLFIILRKQNLVKQKCNVFVQSFKIGEIDKEIGHNPATF